MAKFQKGNKFFDIDKLGAPEYWTPAKIADEIDSLITWAQKETSICLAGWCAERSICTRVFNYLREKSAVFADAHDLAKKTIANRLATMLGTRVHQVHYARYQACYDSELKAHEIDMIKARSTAEAAASIITCDKIKEIFEK